LSKRQLIKAPNAFATASRFNDFKIERSNAGALRAGFSLAQASDTVAILPLAAFLEDLDALKAFHDIALAAQCGRRAQTTML